mgnify:CR=1 FL=1
MRVCCLVDSIEGRNRVGARHKKKPHTEHVWLFLWYLAFHPVTTSRPTFDAVEGLGCSGFVAAFTRTSRKEGGSGPECFLVAAGFTPEGGVAAGVGAAFWCGTAGFEEVAFLVAGFSLGFGSFLPSLSLLHHNEIVPEDGRVVLTDFLGMGSGKN